jgi:hypothetical protein
LFDIAYTYVTGIQWSDESHYYAIFNQKPNLKIVEAAHSLRPRPRLRP